MYDGASVAAPSVNWLARQACALGGAELLGVDDELAVAPVLVAAALVEPGAPVVWVGVG